MTYTAFVFARGGSKGLPGKNTKSLAGKPLIGWSIESALAVDGVDRVVVSTDSHEIAEVARSFGAQTPFVRPAELARDETPEWAVWQHALAYLEQSEGVMPPVILSVPATAPLRAPEDIRRCLDDYENHRPDAVITVSQATRNPYFNMVARNNDGTVALLMSSPDAPMRRQDSPPVLDVATVAYVVDSTFVMRAKGLFDGVVRAVEVPTHRALDVDTPWDFMIAECALSARGVR